MTDDQLITVLQNQVADLIDRVKVLEKQTALARCKPGLAPCERGCTAFMGELPRHDQQYDTAVGTLYSFPDENGSRIPLKFCKNTYARNLLKGETLPNGDVVDKELRGVVQPNDYFWVEVDRV